VVGISGSLNFAKTIKEEIKDFLNKNLKLTLSEEKTKIYHLESEKVKYLGFWISRRKRRYTESKLSTVKSGKGGLLVGSKCNHHWVMSEVAAPAYATPLALLAAGTGHGNCCWVTQRKRCPVPGTLARETTKIKRRPSDAGAATVIVEAPIDSILNKLVEQGYA
jgi:hypothetical protein